MRMGINIKLSVIIPTLNRAKLLEQTLHSISNQTLSEREFEIIVIDNGSTDNTKTICSQYQIEHNNLRYIYDDRPGLHIGRNRGYLESKSDILVYADDDIVASKTWLETIYGGFQDKDTVLIGGNNYPRFDGEIPNWVKSLWTYNPKEKAKRLEPFSIIIIGDETRRVDPGMIFGCNFAIRKEILSEIGGFHPDGMPDQFLKYRGDGESYITSYIRRKRWKSVFYPGASIEHVVTNTRMTPEYIKKVSYRTGISYGFSVLRNMNTKAEYMRSLKMVLVDLFKLRYTLDRNNISDIRKFYIKKGYIYILIQYGLNTNVRKWINRNNYIDAVVPEYHVNNY